MARSKNSRKVVARREAAYRRGAPRPGTVSNPASTPSTEVDALHTELVSWTTAQQNYFDDLDGGYFYDDTDWGAPDWVDELLESPLDDPHDPGEILYFAQYPTRGNH